tara:strand:- start:1721 stop:1921 length:201 start_codon:yes stop_codon:yes gene_type:complete
MSLQLNGGNLILGNGVNQEQFVIGTEDNKFCVKNPNHTLMELRYDNPQQSVKLSNNKYELKTHTKY